MNSVWDKPLLGESNAKTIKGEKLGVLTLILYLAPAESARVVGKGWGGVGIPGSYVNVCPYSTPGCVAACLNTAGRGVYKNVQDARIAKTQALFQDRRRFLDKLAREIATARTRAKLLGMTLAVRLNGTSDLPFLEMDMAVRFPTVQFYGYTKIPPFGDRRRSLPNVHLTYSMAETFENQATAFDVLNTGGNVAVVFPLKRGDVMPDKWMGYRVVDGDDHDVRFMDPVASKGTHGYVIGLRAKGRARRDMSGFVQR
jgi:hypothetical protein